METNRDIDLLIEKQWSEGLSPEAEDVLSEWVSANEEHRKYYERRILLYRWMGIQQRIPIFEKERKKAYGRFLRSIKGENMPFFFVHKIFSRKLVACAAMVVVFLGGGLAVWQQQDKAAEEQVVQGGTREIKVPKGMKERIILADGTKVWLNSGSCLTLSPGFGQTDRELQLEGEGMFEVAKDKHKPFIIRSGDIRVRVTGTVFNFKSYPEERFAKVTLVRGSLDVSSVTGRVPHTVTLKPCEQVVLDRNRDVMEKKVVETAPDVAWTCVGQRDEGISEDTAETEMTEHAGGAEALFFDEMSMEQIVQELERVFHVNIVVKKPGILQEKYYGDFRNRKDIFAILDVMLRGEQVSYQIKGDTVFIGE